ncbi:MAG TPA: UvrD-helicase domain-containing protein [Baekduia sp.]
MSGDFDICGPLPTGVTVLEASAGTGKTYTIAALATRYVAEGTRLDELLIVTFTRLATGELRDRVRQRLSSARAALDRALATDPLGVAGPAADDDALTALLLAGSRAVVERRRDRLAVAIADFDAATITTTHGFCQEVLLGLGVAGDIDPGHRFSEDARDLVDDVVHDLYVNRFHDAAPPSGLDRDQAREVVAAAVGNPSAPLAPVAYDAPDGAVALRHGLAEAARVELDRRKRALALMTFDDLVTRLRATLEGPSGEAVAATLRNRYKIALVDEFQDTDPDQWTIMRLAFAHPGSTLVLIGDPKQAVYAFRGADVYAYLEAAAAADARPTLGTNWRSDRGLLRAFDVLFDHAQLGHEDITYRMTSASETHQDARLHGAPVATPLRIRVAARHDPDIEQTRQGWSKAPAARAHVARDCAADVARLLAAGATVEDGVPLSAGDVAVLVRTNVQARTIKAALDDAGVPAVVNGAGSVFATDAARDWLALLQASERPEYLPRARAVALTAFLAWPAERVAAADDDAWDALQRQLAGWAGLLRRTGVATLMEDITQRERLPERLLGWLGGERVLTDLRHVAELLHGAAIEGRLGITALAAWLRHRMAADDREAGAEDRARRLESDAAAVQVLTVHRAKGLEFGVVYCPFLWDPFRARERDVPAIYHDAERGNVRTIDVSLEARDAAFERHAAAAAAEQAGEELRLAYVALTRAKHQAVLWWATSFACRQSPLGRLVLERDFGDAVPAVTASDADAVASDAAARFRALRDLAPECVALERSLVERAPARSVDGDGAVALEASTFTRGLDARWRRLSYSSITAGAYEARVASEVEEAVGADDAADERPLAAEAVAAPADWAVPSLLGTMPAGTRIGTLVHQVLEETDFAVDDLAAELGERVAAARRRRVIDVGDPLALVDGLRAAIETPLGPMAGDVRLRDLGPGDRLDELTFELPLVGGDTPSGELTLRAVAATLRAFVGAGDPLAGYAERLEDPMLKADLRGYLTGTIDLVARLPRDGGFAIMDYKTNRLVADGVAPTAWHYRGDALVEEMQRSHYALQALLYAVALHRYLRWRLPDHDAERDRPTILYLFLRGMVGEATPRAADGTPAGVFAWRPPAGLLPALSDVLDQGGAAG